MHIKKQSLHLSDKFRNCFKQRQKKATSQLSILILFFLQAYL